MGRIARSTMILMIIHGAVWGQVEPPKPAQEDPIEQLKKIQKLMEQIESELVKAGSKQTSRDQERVRKKIEDMMKSGVSQEEAVRKIQKLFDDSGIKEQKVLDEVKRLMESEKNRTQVLEKIQKLMKQSQSQQSAIEKIEKVFKKSTKGQEKVLSDIDRLISQAKRHKSQGQGQGKPEKKKPGEKEEEKEQAKIPKNSKQQKKNQGAKKPYHPNKDNSKHAGKKASDDTDRWGNLSGSLHELIMSASRGGSLPKYGRLAELYSKILSEMYSDEEEDR